MGDGKTILIGGGLLAVAVAFLLMKGKKAVKFRTTDLNYGPGSSVAFDFTEICGAELKPLGLAWTDNLDVGYTCAGLYGGKTFAVPCSWSDDCKAYVNWVGDYFEVTICSDNAMRYSEYNSNTPAAINTTPESIDPAYEVAC